MNFASDNAAGVSPEILEALARANEGPAMPYGNDDGTRRLETRLAAVFETDVVVFPVATGTAANALSLATATPPWGVIYCHRDSHVNVDECGAPEFFSGGAKLLALDGEHGRIAAGDLAAAITGAGDIHHAQPAAVSLTQATESGTVYRPDDLAAIAAVCREHGLGLQMDGARFTNALVSLDCAPADITWKAGVDVLTLGATKNGAMAAEAVVFFRRELAETFGYRRKRAGHLFSKMRYLSAQLEAWLTDDLWLRNARHANAMARLMADGLATIPGVRLLHPVETNGVFAVLPEAMADGLREAGFVFYPWPGPDRGAVRLLSAFDTRAEDVQAFVDTARRLAGAAPAAAGASA